MEWHEAITLLKPYIFRLSTPNRAGTGWLVSLSKSTPLCAVATAAHVVEREHYWELPIRIFHPESGKSILLRAQDRAIHLIERLDIAAIVFNKDDLPLPLKTLPLVDPGFYLKPGVEIGWLGYPGINKEDLCFFYGRISFYEENDKKLNAIIIVFRTSILITLLAVIYPAYKSSKMLPVDAFRSKLSI